MAKTTKLIIIGLMAMFLIWGYVAKQQATEANKPMFTSTVEPKNPSAEGDALAIDNMKDECEKNGYSKLCQDYIDVVQSRGFEVLSKDGEFWAEVYSE